jgi:hypothetical protein
VIQCGRYLLDTQAAPGIAGILPETRSPAVEDDPLVEMKRLLWLPVQIGAVFTWDKSFRNNPVIGSYLLNRLGLHVVRVMLAHALFRFRLYLLSPLVPAGDRRRFLRDGYIVKKDFLPSEQFAALAAELRRYEGEIREVSEGDTVTQRLFLTQGVRAALPACEWLTRYPALDRLLRYTSSKNRPPFFFVENVWQHAIADGQADPQKDVHTDTFHPCVKAWLYLDEVDRRNGPFVYVPRSHRLTWQRLRWEYRESLRASTDKALGGVRYWDGSFRVSEQDRREMGLPEPRLMEVPANTLVLANVRGFHCRGDAAGPASRLAIWMQARDNPFNPLFTPFPRATARLFETVWNRHLKRVDRNMAERGTSRVSQGRFERH